MDNTPDVNAIAQWDNGTWGHVAVVTSVNGDWITVEEYNYALNGKYGTRTIPASSPHHYIHVAD